MGKCSSVCSHLPLRSMVSYVYLKSSVAHPSLSSRREYGPGARVTPRCWEFGESPFLSWGGARCALFIILYQVSHQLWEIGVIVPITQMVTMRLGSLISCFLPREGGISLRM